jgi:hypothetical protein
LVIFRHDGQFLALQMVKLSSLHDDEGPVDVFYHWRRDTLVNALPMVITSLIWGRFRVAAWRETRVVPQKRRRQCFHDDGSLSLPLLAEDDIDNAADGIIMASSSSNISIGTGSSLQISAAVAQEEEE